VPIVAVVTHHERPQAHPGPGRIGPTPDYHLLAGGALELAPIGGATGPVAGVRPFRHQAFPPPVAGGPQKLERVAGDTLGHDDGLWDTFQRPGQQADPVTKRDDGRVLAEQVHDIEGAISNLRLRPTTLEQGETGPISFEGGDFAVDGLDALVAATERRWPFLNAPHARRLVSSYGTRVERILGTAAQAGDLGEQFGADLTTAEIAYLMDEEWAETAEDVLWRRSSLGLRLSATERAALDRFMTTRSRAGAKKEFH